ncbi:MAG: hypothetical protein HFJ36_00480 [Clostridia bacterium]|nr:hypothetical protein [Clostridia bacterium]
MKEKEELKNNSNQIIENENTSMESAAKLSEVGNTVFGREDDVQTHEQQVLDCPEGTPEQKHELTKALKNVEEMAKLATAKNYIKETKPNSTFSKSQQVQINQTKNRIPEQQTNEEKNNDEKIR